MRFLLKCSVTFLMNISVLLFSRFSGLEVTVSKGWDVVLVLHTEVSASRRPKANKVIKISSTFYEQLFSSQ